MSAGWLTMIDMREIWRAFILGACGTIFVVGLFTLLIKAHPAFETASIENNPSSLSAARPSGFLPRRHANAQR